MRAHARLQGLPMHAKFELVAAGPCTCTVTACAPLCNYGEEARLTLIPTFCMRQITAASLRATISLPRSHWDVERVC